MTITFSITIVFSILFISVEPYKILLYNPKFAYSHVNFLGRIADTLVEAGHHVTVFQPLTTRFMDFNGSTKAEIIQSAGNLEAQLKHEADCSEFMHRLWDINPADPFAPFEIISVFLPIQKSTCEVTLDNEQLLQQLKSRNFDIGITELIDHCSLAIFHSIGLKNIVGAYSTSILEHTATMTGLPLLPSFMPSSCSVYGDDGSFYTRAINTYSIIFSYYKMTENLHHVQDIIDRKFGSDSPRLLDMISNITWHFTNSDPFFDFPAPTLHTIVDIGGIGVKTPKPLNNHWNKILSLRKKTVLFSFGSVVQSSSMSQENKNNIVDTFARFPDVTFIWKYETPEDNIALNVENIVLERWTPQSDLLADSRLTSFITHGGAGSMRESAAHGKPLIVIPVFGDQPRNAYMVSRLGMGIIFNKKDLGNQKVFYNAVYKLINDRSLYEAAQRTQNLLDNAPFTYKEKIVKTIELAGKFGQLPLLKPTGAKMNLIQYYNIDVYFIAISLLFGIFFVLYKMMSLLFRLIRIKVKIGKKMKSS